MIVLRLCKIAVTAAVGVLIFLVGLNNLLDYRTNFEVVQHILSMDAIPPSSLTWRAITSPALHHLCYAFIIATEFLSAGLTLRGAWRLWETRAASAQAFNAAKTLAAAGLTIAFLLYFFGFMAIGGEWFQMWRAGVYNMQEPAFRFIGSVGLALIFIMLADGDAASGAG